MKRVQPRLLGDRGGRGFWQDLLTVCSSPCISALIPCWIFPHTHSVGGYWHSSRLCLLFPISPRRSSHSRACNIKEEKMTGVSFVDPEILDKNTDHSDCPHINTALTQQLFKSNWNPRKRFEEISPTHNQKSDWCHNLKSHFIFLHRHCTSIRV